MSKNKWEPARKGPVCGMVLSPTAAVAEAEHNGKTYEFCAQWCREKCEADPAKCLKWHEPQ